jgi:threonine dehydrogenase-like Zn-dependent dehydrogenase
VPESNLEPINASPEVATLVEPIASCLHAIGKAQISKGEKVIIVGGGLIGILILQLLQLQGVDEVTLNAKYDFQKKLALKWNSVELNTVPDVVILAVGGDGSALQYAVDTVKPQGRVIAMGNIYNSCPLNLKWLVEHEVLVSGSQRYLNREFAQAVEIIEKGLIDLRPLITHEFSLEEITAAFATAKDKMAHQSIKVLIKPGEK